MILTWHIVWKDLVRFKKLFAAWTLLIVAKHLFFGFLVGFWGEANFALLAPLQGGAGLFLSFSVEPIVAYFLVGALVYEDPPAGKDPFWITRPISGGRLLFAKLLTACLLFVAWPILLSVPWWIVSGFSGAGVAIVAGIMAAYYLSVVVVGLACASVTDGYPRYILWTLAGLAMITIALGLSVVLRDAAIARTSESTLLHVGLVLALLILISLEIIRHQFVVRYFRRTFVVVAVGTLIGGALIFSSPLLSLTDRLRRPDPERPEDEVVRFSLAAPVSVIGPLKNPSAALSMPVKIEGLSKSATAYLWVDGTWKSGYMKVWSAHGQSPRQFLLSQAARHILHLPLVDSSPPVESVQFFFKRRYAERIAHEAVSFQGVATLHLSEGKLLAELPVREQTKRFEGGSLSITKLERHGDQLTFNFTEHGSAFSHTVSRYFPGYFALLNRSTGEVIEPARRTGQSISSAQINWVAVSAAHASFAIPAAPGWLDGASFVLIGFDDGHIIKRDFGWQQPPKTAAPAGQSPISPSLKILRQYAGTYVPKENVAVTLTLEGDHLVARGTEHGGNINIPETILYPESETRFSFKESDAVVEFVKDDKGNVTHLVVHQNGQDLIAPRAPEIDSTHPHVR